MLNLLMGCMVCGVLSVSLYSPVLSIQSTQPTLTALDAANPQPGHTDQFLGTTQSRFADYPVYRDMVLEQRLDAALGAGFYPLNREEFHAILADIDQNTPIDTYVRAMSYRAYELLLGEQSPAAAFALVRHLKAHAATSDAYEARFEAQLANAQLLLFDNQHETALSQVFWAETELQHIRDPRLQFFANHLIGRILQQNSQHEDALEYFIRSLEAARNSQNTLNQRRTIMVNLYIARIQAELRNDTAALSITLDTIELAESQQLFARLPDLYLLKGFIEGRDAPTESALRSYTTAIHWADKIGDNRVRLLGRNNIGSILLNWQRYAEAREVLAEGLALAEALGRTQDTDIMLFNQAYIDVLEGHEEQGLAVMQAATERYRRYARQAEVADWLDYLAHAYEVTGRYQQQAQTLLEQRQLRDEIYRTERNQTFNALQIRYESQEQSRQIELLRQYNELQSEQLANQKLQQRVVKLIVVIAVLGLVILVIAYRAVRQANRRLNVANRALYDQSVRDPLTGLLNRRALATLLEQHQRLAGETDALFLVDIDYFKQINDIQGHSAGDQVLRIIAKRLKQVCRGSDLVVRWGGEEFLIILKNTDSEMLANFSTRLLNAIGGEPITHGEHSIAVTATGGFVALPLLGTDESDLSWERAIQLADLLLYYGKAHGRNQVNGIVAFKPNAVSPSTVTPNTITSDPSAPTESIEIVFANIDAAIRNGWVESLHIAGPKPAL